MNFARPDVCAVAVTYFPGSAFPISAAALAAQTGAVIVVDNKSQGASAEIVRAAADAVGAFTILNKKNMGVATALNMGCREALRRGYAWVLLCDQDSYTPPGFVDGLFEAYAACPFRNEVQIVGPTLRDQQSGKGFADHADSLSLWRDAVALATSGCLVATAAFGAAGFFRDDYFIDHVDYEFCLRVRQAGGRVIQATSVMLDHNPGASRQHRFLGKSVWASHHAPLRYYYMVRNRMFTAASYFWREPRWVLSDLWSFLKNWLKVAFFESDRLEKFRMSGKGLFHALLRRSGAYQP